MLKNDTCHDMEILGIYRNSKNLNILLADRIIVLENIKHWEFSSFDNQNIVFSLNYFNINKVPNFLIENYPWLANYKSLNTLKVIEIHSAVGLDGVAIFTDLKIQKRAKNKTLKIQ